MAKKRTLLSLGLGLAVAIALTWVPLRHSVSKILVKWIILPSLQAYVTQNSENSKAWNLIGMGNGAIGQWDGAITAYQRAIHINPAQVDSYYYLGNLYDNLNRYEEALPLLEHAVQLQPNFRNAAYELGVTYGKLGQHQRAAEAYREALRFNSRDIETLNNLAWEDANLGRYSEAVAGYEAALRIQPKNVRIHGNFCLLLIDIGKKDSALQQAQFIADFDRPLAEELYKRIEDRFSAAIHK